MEYVSLVPRAPLDTLIDDLYYLEGVAPYPQMLVPPMPSALLIVNLDGPFRIRNAAAATAPAEPAEGCFVGTPTRHIVIDYPAYVRIVGVHFKPWGAYPFIRVPLSELRDQVVPTGALWGRFADEVRGRLHDAQTPLGMLITFEQLLRRRLSAAPGLGLVRHVGGRIADAYGAVSIGAISDDADVSTNHLGNRFKALVGLTPKQLARIYRFARVVIEVDPSGSVEWGELAHRAGYYDQSHFTKEFVAFTGRNPTEYLRLRRRFLSEHPGHALDLGPLPT